jgi:hypothetical protein
MARRVVLGNVVRAQDIDARRSASIIFASIIIPMMISTAACGLSMRSRDPSQPCFTIGHALSLRGRPASSAGTVASSLR